MVRSDKMKINFHFSLAANYKRSLKLVRSDKMKINFHFPLAANYNLKEMHKRFLSKRTIWIFVVLLPLISGIFFVLQNASAQNENLSYGSSDVPVILPRSTWDNTPSLNALMTWLPQNTDFPSDWQPVERIIIHDTGCDISNPTCNNNLNPISTIQGIYRYHAVTRDWGDIGYNYIIDQQGRLYEGRYGGNGSRGAHTYLDRAKDNFNFGSIGITVLGNYALLQPSPAVYDSLERLIGWLTVANNLDAQGQRSSFIWNQSKGGFKSLYTGPIVVGHKDVEPGNPDPASFDFARIQREATTWAIKYKDYIYQPNNGSPKVYKLFSGARQIFDSLADFVAKGGVYNKLASLAPTQLDLFSESRFLKYPDGSLLQVNGEPTIFLIDNGKRRNFDVNAKQFVKLGFDFAAVRKVTMDELGNYLSGEAIKYGPDNALLSDGVKVYFIQNGKKRWIPSGTLFTTLGYKWLKVKTDAGQLATLLEENIMTYPDGTLLRETGGATVYLMKGGQKHQFVSGQSFVKLGYRWDKVLLVPASELNFYPAGYFVAYADGTLIKSVADASIYLVDKGKIRLFLSGEIFKNLKYKSASVLTVDTAELAYYPLGEPVKYADGTLLRKKSGTTVYLVAAGKLQPVDAATFKKKKYKWANVLVIADSDFVSLYEAKSSTPVVPSVTPVASTTPITSLTPTSTPTSTITPAIAIAQPKIRIGLFEAKEAAVTFSATSAYDVFDKNGQIVATKKAGENFVYNISSPAESFVKVVPQAADAAVEIVSYEEHPTWKPSLNYNKFRGSVEIVYSNKSQKLWAVNELLLEDYLKGVAETSEGDTAEYQKTMIVAARTYAYYYILKGGKRGADEVYHLLNTTADQLYKGYSREILAPSLATAVEATRGEIVVYNNAPIVAAYSSGSVDLKATGSRSACSVWGSAYCQAGFEYLAGGVKDPSDTEYKYSTCSGANHCVGLSGAGTRQFAKSAAKNYQEILKYYYPGVEIKKIY